MKVGRLIEILEKFNPDLDVIIKRDVQIPGYGFLDRIELGIFTFTEYGNDFHWGEEMTVGPDESKALCLVAEDDIPEDSEKPRL